MKKLKKPKAKLIDQKISHQIYESLDFAEIQLIASRFADHIIANAENIINILLEYESYEVVKDEINRALDILQNLHENKNFFVKRVGAVTAFLPRNQPLYALSCFVIVPSFMATEVHFRIPHSMRGFFPQLLEVLNIKFFFPNIFVSGKERMHFLEERSSLLVDPTTEESIPVSDVVIFTGTSTQAEKLRLIFDKRTLFITNGSGHNPVIVSDDADISKAVEACLDLQLYNQGQDCAAPNTVLVHEKAFENFLVELRKGIGNVKVGHYKDRSCRVGPISEPEDLVRIQSLLVENMKWLDSTTKGIIRAQDAIVEPTIICKPLNEGGNYSEVFSPIIFVQKYDGDQELSKYFEDNRYQRNAMYITLYGTSDYIQKFIKKKINGKVIHDEGTLLQNIHLHMKGVERGVQPYGGYGYAASNICIHGKITSKPTLPQRDIYENLVLPFIKLNGKTVELKKNSIAKMDKILNKDIKKLLGLKINNNEDDKFTDKFSKSYFDSLDIIASDSQRYIEFTPEKTYKLLANPNAEFISIMEPKRIHQIRALAKSLKDEDINHGDINKLLYSLPKNPDYSEDTNKEEQLDFFKNIYKLLFNSSHGPRLAYFLLDADRIQILHLLNV